MLVDWLLFVSLSAAGLPTTPANLVGRAGGALLGFWLNGAITFRAGSRARLGWPHLIRFVISWGMMSLLSTGALVLIDRNLGLHWAWIAKPLVDGILALAGFFVSRHWIYRAREINGI